MWIRFWRLYFRIEKVKMVNIPNLLSLFRLFLIPIFLYFIAREQTLYSAVVFAIIIITDILDGYIARKKNECTNLGRVLDHGVDKLFIILTAIWLYIYNSFPLWATFFFVLRELIILTAGFLFLIDKKLTFTSMAIGKISGGFFYLTIFLYLLRYDSLAVKSLYISVILFSIATLWYTVLYFPRIKEVYNESNNS